VGAYAIVRGQVPVGNGTVAEDPVDVSEFLLLLRAARYQRYVGIQLSPAGERRDPDALRRQAETRVVARIADLRPMRHRPRRGMERR